MKATPTLLVCDELLESIATQKQELNKCATPTPANFLFAYALFEGILRELSFQFYYAFPKRLKGAGKDASSANEYFEIQKDALLWTNDYYFVLNTIIDKKLFNLSKDSLYSFITTFLKISNISFSIDKDLLVNMTMTRNIIAHNNAYNVKPWNIRSEMFSDIVRQSNLKIYIEYINSLIRLIEIEIEKKYKKFTYEKLLLDSWNYTCPKLSIYDIFDFKTGTAKIKVESAIKRISELPVTEKYLVSVWIENHNLDDMYKIMSKVGEVYTPAHIAKRAELHYLQQLFQEFPFLLDEQPFCVENGKLKI